MRRTAIIYLAVFICSLLPGAYVWAEPLGREPHATDVHFGPPGHIRPNPAHRMPPHGGMPGPHEMRPPARDARRITPYGDFCENCSKYGIGSRMVTPKEASEALESYFESRGLGIKNVIHRGRFMRADVTKGEEMVDRVILDRMTGRVRSIY